MAESPSLAERGRAASALIAHSSPSKRQRPQSEFEAVPGVAGTAEALARAEWDSRLGEHRAATAEARADARIADIEARLAVARTSITEAEQRHEQAQAESKRWQRRYQTERSEWDAERQKFLQQLRDAAVGSAPLAASGSSSGQSASERSAMAQELASATGAATEANQELRLAKAELADKSAEIHELKEQLRLARRESSGSMETSSPGVTNALVMQLRSRCESLQRRLTATEQGGSILGLESRLETETRRADAAARRADSAAAMVARAMAYDTNLEESVERIEQAYEAATGSPVQPTAMAAASSSSAAASQSGSAPVWGSPSVTSAAAREASQRRAERTLARLEAAASACVATLASSEARGAATAGRAAGAESRVGALRADLEDLRQRLRESEAKAAQEALGRAEAEDVARRSATRVSIAREEALELRKLLESDSSLPLAIAAASSVDASVSGGLDAIAAAELRASIKSLQRQCKDYEEKLAASQVSLVAAVKEASALSSADASTGSASSGRQRIEQLEEQLTQVADRAKTAEAENDALVNECGALRAEAAAATAAAEEAKRAAGHGGSAGGVGFRILHLRHNPTQAARDVAAEKQRAATAALEEQVAHLRTALAAKTAADSADRSSSSSSAQAHQLSTSVLGALGDSADATTRLNRLKELFSSRMAAIREAVYVLTGWKVDLQVPASPSEPVLVRLRSVYFGDETDHLAFALPPAKPSPPPPDSSASTPPAAEVQMLDTELARALPEDVTAYLTVCHSFPAFLSAVMLAQFERQTQTIGPMLT